MDHSSEITASNLQFSHEGKQGVFFRNLEGHIGIVGFESTRRPSGIDMENATNGTETDSMCTGGDTTISSWAMIIAMIGIFVLLLSWCVFSVYKSYTTRAQVMHEPQPSNTEGGEKKMPRKARAALLLAYFEQSGHEVEVKDSFLVPCCEIECSNKTDIEMGDLDEKSEEDGTDNTGDHSLCHVLYLKDTSYYQQSVTTTSQAPQDVGNGDEESPSSEANVPVRQRPTWVSDSCAICFEPYQPGDTVVWSCTQSCPHVFHQGCVVDYLARNRSVGTPCPYCRQQFCSDSVFSPSNADETGNTNPDVPTLSAAS